MKDLNKNSVTLAVCIAISFLLAMPMASFAADQDRDRVQLRLRDQICEDTGLSKAQMSKYEPLIAESLKLNGGDTEPVRNMFRKSVGEGCVDECLMERLRTRNRVMKQQHLGAEGETQEMTRERTRERVREQAGDQSGNQTQTQNQEQSGTGSGGGKGN